jgi:hypothetical protein
MERGSILARWRDDPVLARAAPFAIFIGMLMLASALPAAAPWLAVARGAVVALALAWFWRSYGELRAPGPAHPGHWLLAVAAGLGVFAAWIWLDQDWARISRPAAGYAPLGPGGGIDWPMALARLAGLALVVPVMEELFWRSFLLRWIARRDFLALAPRSAGLKAFAITTALFALEHNQWLAGALAGMTYSALYMRSGNLWVPILAHAVTNAALGAWILHTRSWQFW